MTAAQHFADVISAELGADFELAANEHGSFTLAVDCTGIYGADTRWSPVSLKAGGPQPVENSTFGVDPAPNAVKALYVPKGSLAVVEAPPVAAQPTPGAIGTRAGDGRTCRTCASTRGGVRGGDVSRDQERCDHRRSDHGCRRRGLVIRRRERELEWRLPHPTRWSTRPTTLAIRTGPDGPACLRAWATTSSPSTPRTTACGESSTARTLWRSSRRPTRASSSSPSRMSEPA